MNVKQLITMLLDYDMNEPVYIGLGPYSLPDDSSTILKLIQIESGSIDYGVYIIPSDCLKEAK